MDTVVAQVTFVLGSDNKVRAVTDFRQTIPPKELMGLIGQASASLYNVARDLGRAQKLSEKEIRQLVFPNAARRGS